MRKKLERDRDLWRERCGTVLDGITPVKAPPGGGTNTFTVSASTKETA